MSDNLNSPAYPVYDWQQFEDGKIVYNNIADGFTKLEKAALMIASGHVINVTATNSESDERFLKAFGAKCVSLAKAVLEEANK